jgi:DNA replication protein DnaC
MYTRETYNKVKEEIQRRRDEAHRTVDVREALLREESPEIKEIDTELEKTGLLIFKTAICGKDITPIRERNRLLMERRASVLKKLGYPEDYTVPHYTCKICSDSGYTVEGAMCSCMKELLRLESIKASGIGRLIEKQSFENFDFNWYCQGEERDRMKYNFIRTKSFAEGFTSTNGKNLLLIGKTGTGKTHLSTAIAKTVIEKGFSVLYDSTQNILAAFESDKFRSIRDDSEYKSDKYLEADLLILDDLGAEFTTQFTVSCLYNLLNTRYNRGLSTVISTNLSDEELQAKYEDRIFSRLVGQDTEILLFVGRDKRICS